MKMSLVSRFVMALVISLLTATVVHGQTSKTEFPFTPELLILEGDPTTFPLQNYASDGVLYHMRIEIVISHPRPPDLDITFVKSGLNNKTVVLMSDVGSSAIPWVRRKIVFDDCAPRTLDETTLPDGAYRPTNVGFTEVYDGYESSLSDLNGTPHHGSYLSLADDGVNGILGTLHSFTLTFFWQDGPAQTSRNQIGCSKPDYDGDGRADISIYRPETGDWFIQQSGDNGALRYQNWGAPGSGDVAVPADYDGDGLTDPAVYRIATGEWWIRRSFDGGVTHASWGAPSHYGTLDKPVPSDYDGDGRADLAIYRSSSGHWFILNSGDNTVTTRLWGNPPTGDYPAR